MEDQAAPKAKRGCGFYALVGLGGFIALGVLGSLLPEPPAPSPAQQAAEATAKEAVDAAEQEMAAGPEVTRVTARELHAAYAENEVAAKAKYGDRVLEVTGTVQAIELDLTDDPVVRFEVGQMYSSVAAGFDKSAAAQTGALKKGQTATVRCAKVTEIVGDPYLRDCQLVN